MAYKRIAVILALLSGCATQPVTVKPPMPPVIEMPIRAIPKEPPDEVVRAIRLYINELENRLKQAIEALEVYRR
jgi:hypothetical protein